MNDYSLEADLPIYLQNDINNLKERKKRNLPLSLDGLYSELKNSINIAHYGGSISECEAEYLKKKYLPQK